MDNQLHAGIDTKTGEPTWHTDRNGNYWCGNWHTRTPEQLLDEAVAIIADLLHNHPELRSKLMKITANSNQ